MSGTKTIISPVPYTVAHDSEDYPTEKIEIELQDGQYRKRTVKVWSAKRGVEGLLFCFDAFKRQCVDKFEFDVQDIEEYFPAMLDNEAERRWNTVWSGVPAAEKSVARFDQAFAEFVTIVSGSSNPRDDLIEYITHAAECKKKKDADVDVHVSRIITLCLLANRLKGTATALTDDQITLAIFHSFPETWQSNFRLHRGRPTDSTREAIIAYFRDNKAIQDSRDEGNKQKRKDRKGTTQAAGEGGGKRAKKNDCRHHGTHPWSECSLNPRSKNYFLTPSSPFYRGGNGGRGGSRGRMNGRGDGGRIQGRYGRGGHGQYDHRRGRGEFAGGNRSNSSNSNQSNDQYYGGDRGSDRGQEPGARDQQGQYPTPGQGRVADLYHQQQPQQDNRNGGW
jgi:hypothetical protein